MLNYLYGVISGAYGNIVYWSTGCCSTNNTQVTATSSVNVSAATTAMNALCADSITNTQTGNYVGTSNIPSISCVPPTVTTYWSTGCCSSNNLQVTGTSTSNSSAATTAMNNNCSGGTVSNIQTGSYTSTSNIPSVNCAPPPPTCTPVCGAWSYTYGTWSGWSSCAGGTQTRTRTVTGTRTCTASNCSTYTETSSSTETESQSCGTVWYCTTSYYTGGSSNFTSSSDVSATVDCNYVTNCSLTGYPGQANVPC
jgi:hypothetical protein